MLENLILAITFIIISLAVVALWHYLVGVIKARARK